MSWVENFLKISKQGGTSVRDLKVQVSRIMCLILIALRVCFFWTDKKHSKIANFSDKSLKDELHFKLFRKLRTVSGSHTANCLGSSGFKFDISFMKPWISRRLLKNISLSIVSRTVWLLRKLKASTWSSLCTPPIYK